MTKFNITTENEITVAKRDGAVVHVDMAQVPQELAAGFIQDGIAEFIRDSSSAALVEAYTTAHDGESGDVESRKAWAETPEAASLIQAASQSMMEAALDNLYAGIRRVARSGGSVDPLDEYRVRHMRQLMKAAPDGKLATAYKAIPSDDQKARREFLLSVATKNADKIDPEAEALRQADIEKEKAAAKAAKNLSL